MDNFVLYDEMENANGITMHKGRRKGTITFLAICCIDKGIRAKITNHVRFAIEMNNASIVKFFEWYETSNHLWLVTELCTGGKLSQMLEEDKHLPEPLIRMFGEALVRGLFEMHSKRVIYCDWDAANILLDGLGSVKYFDFTKARRLNEDLEQTIADFMGTDKNLLKRDDLRQFEPKVHYMAPESISSGRYDEITDLWSLGCLLYHLFCGAPPFQASNAHLLKERIMFNTMNPMKTQGIRLTGRPTQHFQNLIVGLLVKNPQQRTDWIGLVSHPFWENVLDDLASTLGIFRSTDRSLGPRDTNENREYDTKTSENFSVTHPPKVSKCTENNSEMDDISFAMHTSSRPTNEDSFLIEGNVNIRSTLKPNIFTDRNVDRMEESFVKSYCTCSLKASQNALFSLAMSQFTSPKYLNKADCLQNYKKYLSSVHGRFDYKLLPMVVLKASTIQALSDHELSKYLNQVREAFCQVEKGPPSQKRVHLVNFMCSIAVHQRVARTLFQFNIAQETVKQLKTNIVQDMRLRLCKLLSIICYSNHFFLSLDDSAFNLVTVLSQLEVLINALGDLIREHFRNVKLKEALLAALAEALIELNHLLCGLDFRESQEQFNVNAMVFAQVVRCLNKTEDPAVSLLACRCIELTSRLGRTVITKAFATHETLQLLWTNYANSTLDTLKLSSIEALVNLVRFQPSILLPLLDKIGLVNVTSKLNHRISSNQLPLLKALNFLLISQEKNSSYMKLIQDSSLIAAAIQNLEDPTASVRVQAYLLIYLLCQQRTERIKECLEKKFFSQLERDLKICATYYEDTINKTTTTTTTAATTTSKPTNRKTVENTTALATSTSAAAAASSTTTATNTTAPTTTRAAAPAPATASLGNVIKQLTEIVNKLCRYFVETVGTISEQILHCLGEASGRKHPPAVQLDRLRKWLPLLPLYEKLVNFSNLRNQILCNKNTVTFFGRLLKHSLSLMEGNTVLDGDSHVTTTNTSSSSLSVTLLNASFHFVELLFINFDTVRPFVSDIVSNVLPQLAQMSILNSNRNSSNRLRMSSVVYSEYSMIAFKLFADYIDILCTIKDPSTEEVQLVHIALNIVSDTILPSVGFHNLHSDPSVISFLHILLNFNLISPVLSICALKNVELFPNLLEVLQSLCDTDITSTVTHLIAELLGRIINSVDSARKMALTNRERLHTINVVVKELFFDLNFPAVAMLYFQSVLSFYNEELNHSGNFSKSAYIKQALELCMSLLRYTTDGVKRALQAKHASSSPASAASTNDVPSSSSTVSAAEAEQLLLRCRQMTALLHGLSYLLIHEDLDVREGALKCLSFLAGLYGNMEATVESVAPYHGHPATVVNGGGDSRRGHGFNDDNLRWLMTALRQFDLQHCRLIVRILKRFLGVRQSSRPSSSSSNSNNSSLLDVSKAVRQEMIVVLHELAGQAKSQVDINLSNLIQDVVLYFEN